MNTEMKAAVLAEFRQVCLRPMYFYPVDNDTRLIFNGTQYEIYIGLNCLLSLSVVGENKNTDWLAAYRLLGLEAKAKNAEIQRLREELEEAKQIKLEGMQHPAWYMVIEFVKFMEEAFVADCPMITDWRVKRHETGEDVVVLNIWAATTHESPITRCRELRASLDAVNSDNERLREGIQVFVDYMRTDALEFGMGIWVDRLGSILKPDGYWNPTEFRRELESAGIFAANALKGGTND